MKLSKRIHKIADMISHGEKVADIGTDHGYVPMLLIQNNISPDVILSDISEASLAKARKTFEMAGIELEEGHFRTGDGLSTISPGETDALIIAGLGAHTIVDILDADISKSKSFKKLVLQPRKHSGALRYYLHTHGWHIESEELAQEGKFQCEIIVAVPTDKDEAKAPYPADDISWKFPRSIVTNNPELAAARLRWKISDIMSEVDNLEKSDKDYKELICTLKSDLNYLKELLSEAENSANL